MSTELKQLIIENPELPVIAWVNYEVCGDDINTRWMGEFGSARVAEVTMYKMYGENRFFEKNDTDDLFDYLVGQDEEGKTDAEIEAFIDALPWKRAILVNVDLPDSWI